MEKLKNSRESIKSILFLHHRGNPLWLTYSFKKYICDSTSGQLQELASTFSIKLKYICTIIFIKQLMKKILIIQTAFIGDVILATPIIEKLHQKFPDAQLDFLLRKGNEALLKNHPFLNEVLIWNKKQNKTKNLFSTLQKIRRKNYDLVVNCQRFLSTGILTAFSNGEEKIGFDKNPLSAFFTKKIKHQIADSQQLTHEVQRNHELIKFLTDDQPALPKLYPSKANFEKVKKEKPYVCIAPTSVWFTKQLPAEKWLELIEKLPTQQDIYLLGATSDFEACENIKTKSNHTKIHNLAGKLNLLESAALMSDAKMNYVNDSAPLHLASAMNAPVTGVFCSTIPNFGFTPLSSVRRVLETKEKLDCRPCGLHGFKACPKGHFKCSNIEF